MKNANEESFKSAKANKQLARSSQILLDEYESLVKDGIEPTVDEKKRLDEITIQLKGRLGESVVAIDKETGAFILNTDAVREQIKIKRFSADQEAATLASRLLGAQEAIMAAELAIKVAIKEEEINRRIAKQNNTKSKNAAGFLVLNKARRDADVAAGLAVRERSRQEGILNDQRENEADLLEKLNELNFTAADVAALFNVEEKETIGLLGEENKLITDLIEKKQAEIKARREIAAINKPALIVKNQELEVLNDELRVLRELGIEKDKEEERIKLDKKQGIDPAVVNRIDQELQARVLLDIERERIDNETRGRFLQTEEFEKLSITRQFELRKEFFDKQQELINRDVDARRQAMEDETFFQNLLIEQRRDAEQEAIDTITKERLREEKRISGVKGWTDRKKEIFIEGEAEKRKAKERSDDEILLNETALQNELLALDNGRLSSYQASEEARVAANKEANDAILAAEKAANEKRKAENIKMFNDIVNKTQEALDRINKGKEDALNDEISEARESVKVQQKLAAAGGDNILAEEKARLAKLGLERKRELERQALQERRIALAQNFVNSLAAHSKDDPKGAFAKAAFETFAGEAFAKLIAGFYDGTEDTGTVNKPLDTKGGRLAVLHNNERVMTAKQNAKVGAMTNPELADLAYNYQNGDLSPSHFKQLELGNMMQPNNVSLMPMITELGKQTDRLEKAFEKGQVAYEVHWNEQGEAIRSETRRGITNALKFKKSRV
jgi:hypothetical protein